MASKLQCNNCTTKHLPARYPWDIFKIIDPVRLYCKPISENDLEILVPLCAHCAKDLGYRIYDICENPEFPDTVDDLPDGKQSKSDHLCCPSNEELYKIKKLLYHNKKILGSFTLLDFINDKDRFSDLLLKIIDLRNVLIKEDAPKFLEGDFILSQRLADFLEPRFHFYCPHCTD